MHRLQERFGGRFSTVSSLHIGGLPKAALMTHGYGDATGVHA